MSKHLRTATLLILPAAFFLAALVFFLTPAYADGPSLDDQVIRISKNLYCPVCPATPLDVCETQACVQWRNLIKQKLIEGETEEQIRAYFIAQYGDRVLGAPPPVGFNLGAYILPLLLILAGGGVLFFTIRGWMKARRPSGPESILPTTTAGEYAERIAQELKESE